jgi:hypothetical protein
MKQLLLLPAALVAMSVASCGPVTPADFSSYKQEQQGRMPKLAKAYRNGQTPAQVRASIKKEEIEVLGEETARRPINGWAQSSWESLQEQSSGAKVMRVDRFRSAGFSYMAPVLYFHRVFYDAKGRSSGWFVTSD